MIQKTSALACCVVAAIATSCGQSASPTGSASTGTSGRAATTGGSSTSGGAGSTSGGAGSTSGAGGSTESSATTGGDPVGTGGAGGTSGASGTGSGGASVDAGGPVGPCEANATRACTCAGAGTGSMRCLPNGTGWTACGCEAYGAEIAVSPTGNDAGPGTLAQPFATLERARGAARQLIANGIPNGGVVVWLRGGVYERSATLDLASMDSGKSGAPIVWRGYPGERARLVGGKRVDPSWFAAVTSASPLFNRFDATARGNIVQIDLKAHGITDFGALAHRGFSFGGAAALELFIDGAAMTLARWPDASTTDRASGYVRTGMPSSSTSFAFANARPRKWATTNEIWVHGFWGNLWADEHLRATRIDGQTVTLSMAPAYGPLANQPFYVYNVPEEITAPGEWYLDRSTGVLYVWPPAPLRPTTDVVVSLLAAPLVTLSSATFVTLRDFTLEATRTSLVEIRSGQDDRLEGLVLRNAGTDAALVDGTRNIVHHCEVTGPGEAGIVLSGGDRKTLTSGASSVESCDIHGFGRFGFTYNPGIRAGGVGHALRNNAIHDAPHAAILWAGNEHVIELNDVYDVCHSSSDSGAIYSGRDWGYRGDVIRYNFIHNMKTWQGGLGTHAIYLDDTLAGVRVEGNVIYKVSGSGIKHGGGRDVVSVNNVITYCDNGFNVDMRGSTRMTKYDLVDGLLAVGYRDEPWKSRYPECAAIPDNWAAISAPDALWLYPQNSVYSRNIGFMNTNAYHEVGTPFMYFKERKDNIDNQDPLFVDESHLDMTLRPDSPALAIPGFQPIPFDRIGIRP